MKIKYIAVPALALLASCAWTQRQSDSFTNWADKNMPTYDNSNHSGSSSSAGNNSLIPNQYNGYPYNSALPRTAMNAPGVSGAVAPTLPGYNVAPAGITTVAEKGLTPAQTSSAGEGGNSRPTQAAYNNNMNNNPAPAAAAVPSYPSYPAMTPAANNSNTLANTAASPGRRVPSGMLPPSAIQPVPYGQQQPAANADFPAEYKNSGQPAVDSTQDPMIPPPPI